MSERLYRLMRQCGMEWRCQFLYCGAPVPDGRHYCDDHRINCAYCKDESQAHINGKSVCWEHAHLVGRVAVS